MNPNRPLSSSAQNPDLYELPNQQPDARPTPPPDVAIRRFCRRCDKYIEYPPYFVSDCCHNTYHGLCSILLADRDVEPCGDCQTTMTYSSDGDFAREVEQYDWSLLAPDPHTTARYRSDGNVSPVQASDSEGPGELAGGMASLQEQARFASPQVPPRTASETMDFASVVAGTLQKFSPTVIETAYGRQEAAFGVPLGLSFGQQEPTTGQQLGSVLAALDNMVHAQQMIGQPSSTSPASATATIQPMIRPSEELHIGEMTRAVELLLAEFVLPTDLLALKDQKGYRFIKEMMEDGVVPKWVTICNTEGTLPGKRVKIDSPEATDVFFNALQQHADQLEPGNPFFVTFVRSRISPLTGQSEQFSPVLRIIRHPTRNMLMVLSTANLPVPAQMRALQRLSFSGYRNGTELAKFLKFLLLSSEASEALFIRPTRGRGTPAEGLESIEMNAFIGQYPPRDFGGNLPASDKKILLSAAQSLGLERIRKQDAKNIDLLNIITGSDLRSSELNSEGIEAHLQENGYSTFITDTASLEPQVVILMTAEGEERTNMEIVSLQQRVAMSIEVMRAAMPPGEKGYILLKLNPQVAGFPEEILLLVCDQDRFYLVNMKNKAVSTQCSSNLQDITDYCQVFMAGARIRHADITSYVPTQLKKTRAS